LLFDPKVPLGEYFAGAVLAFGAAYLSARFLLRYFRSGRLDPYGWYCAAAGLACFALLTFLP
jgi:undecaprenyl-diphosphatase